MEILGWQAFADKYKPINNKFRNYEETTFETFGEELEFVKSQDPRHIWTWVDGDMCSLVTAGFGYVNRLAYYITEVPWENEEDYVLLSVEKECECYSEDDDVMASRNEEYGDPDCQLCEGYGLVTEYVG